MSVVEYQSGLRRPDIAAIAARGLLGAIPYIGPLSAEVISTLIRNQRIDRLEKFCQILNEKLGSLQLEKEELERRLVRQESNDLIEDGYWQAARALSEERKEHVASLIKNSLTTDQLGYIKYKQLLFILGELNDIEVLILKSYSLSVAERHEFLEKHKEALHPRYAHMKSSHDEIDEAIVYESYIGHLQRMQLLEDKPVTDITALGRLLLHSIDQFKWP